MIAQHLLEIFAYGVPDREYCKSFVLQKIKRMFCIPVKLMLCYKLNNLPIRVEVQHAPLLACAWLSTQGLVVVLRGWA